MFTNEFNGNKFYWQTSGKIICVNASLSALSGKKSLDEPMDRLQIDGSDV
jgi:hypothetical protein